MNFHLPGFRKDNTNRSLTNVGSPLEDFYHDIARMSPHLFSRNFEKGFIPNIDILETDQEYCVETELPGVEQGNIEIKLENNLLTIKGHKSFAEEKKDDNYYTRERSYGEFHRSITMPSNINEDKIEANLKNGVLTVKVPKKNITNSKKVSVKIS